MVKGFTFMHLSSTYVCVVPVVFLYVLGICSTTTLVNSLFEVQASNEDAKSVEISKLQKTVESLILELDAAKLRALNEYNKNMVLQRQIDSSAKEKSAFDRETDSLSKLRNENSVLKVIFVKYTSLNFKYPLYSSGNCICSLIFDFEELSIN